MSDGPGVRTTTEKLLLQKTMHLRLLGLLADRANTASSLAWVLRFAINEMCAHLGMSVGHAYVVLVSRRKEPQTAQGGHAGRPDLAP